MCPACIATLAMVAAGAVSTGGLTALIINRRLAATGSEDGQPADLKEKESGGKWNGE